MLPKNLRVVKDKEFSAIYKAGSRARSKNLTVTYLKQDQNISRFGFVVSKKQAHRIVRRNRVKRRLRAQVSQLLPRVTAGFDLIISARESVLALSGEELRFELAGLLKKVKLLR